MCDTSGLDHFAPWKYAPSNGNWAMFVAIVIILFSLKTGEHLIIIYVIEDLQQLCKYYWAVYNVEIDIRKARQHLEKCLDIFFTSKKFEISFLVHITSFWSPSDDQILTRCSINIRLVLELEKYYLILYSNLVFSGFTWELIVRTPFLLYSESFSWRKEVSLDSSSSFHAIFDTFTPSLFGIPER